MMKYSLKPDFQKAAAMGVGTSDIAAVLMSANDDKAPVDVFVGLDKEPKRSIDDILKLKVTSKEIHRD